MHAALFFPVFPGSIERKVRPDYGEKIPQISPNQELYCCYSIQNHSDEQSPVEPVFGQVFVQ